MGAFLQLGQQAVNEVEAGFDGDDHAGLQLAGEAQEGMAFGRFDAAAVGAGHEAADVVYLQADQVAQSVREERRADARTHRVVGAAVEHVLVDQHLRQLAMAVEVQLRVVGAGAHGGAQALLHGVDAVDQVLERADAARVGAGDIGGVADHLCAGVDQEAAAVAGRGGVLVLVVQHGAVFIEADDVAVGQVAVEVAAGGEVGALDAEFGLVRAEGGFGGAVTGDGALLGAAHHHQLVGRFCCARIVQWVDHGCRIVRHVAVDGGIGLAKDGGLRGRRQLGGDVRCVAHDADVEGIDPVAARVRRHQMPEIVRLVVDQRRLPARRDCQPAARVVVQRRPSEELRVRPERIRHVVVESVLVHAGGDQQVIKTTGGEHGFGLALAGGDVLGEKSGKVVLEHDVADPRKLRGLRNRFGTGMCRRIKHASV